MPMDGVSVIRNRSAALGGAVAPKTPARTRMA